MENLVRQIRDFSGMNQEDFARAIKRSTAMLRHYEKGITPPLDVIETLKTLAVKAGHPEIAVALSSDEWKVQRVFQPGETIISAPRRAANSEWHQMLDEVLDSGQRDAIEAVQSNLLVFVDRVRLRKQPEKSSVMKRTMGRR